MKSRNYRFLQSLAALALPACILVALSGCKKDDDKGGTPADNTPVQFVFTSDAHYGITRPHFQGADNVDAHVVNAALVGKINSLASLTLPSDGGLNAGQKISTVDYIFEGGDIANRMETSAKVQTAAASWAQFQTDYLQGITLKGKNGQTPEMLMVPGNHDVSNTVGYYATMSPLEDNTSLVNIYNMMLKGNKTTSNFDYMANRVNYSRDIAGVHFCFFQMWPDSSVRIWMAKDLANVPATTPVILVAHDQPAVVSNHFTNPNGKHDINNTDKFDGVLDEEFKDGTTTTPPSNIEQRAFVAFLKAHSNIKAYLHGHVHQSQFYVYNGPDNDVALNAISADSPMKGVVSMNDETKLTFDFVVLDPKTKSMTVRECYWDADPTNPAAPIKWGNTITIDLTK